MNKFHTVLLFSFFLCLCSREKINAQNIHIKNYMTPIFTPIITVRSGSSIGSRFYYCSYDRTTLINQLNILDFKNDTFYPIPNSISGLGTEAASLFCASTFSDTLVYFYFRNILASSKYCIFNSKLLTMSCSGLENSNQLLRGMGYPFATSNYFTDSGKSTRALIWMLRAGFGINIYLHTSKNDGNIDIDSIFKPNVNEFDRLYGDGIVSKQYTSLTQQGHAFKTVSVLKNGNIFSYSGGTFGLFSALFRFKFNPNNVRSLLLKLPSVDTLSPDTAIKIQSMSDSRLGFQWVYAQDSASNWESSRRRRYYLYKLDNETFKTDFIRLSRVAGRFGQEETPMFSDSAGGAWLSTYGVAGLLNVLPNFRVRVYDTSGGRLPFNSANIAHINDMGKKRSEERRVGKEC